MSEQGRIHGYRSRVRVGRGHIWGHQTIWAGAVRSKNKIHKKSKMWPTDWQTDQPTKRGVESRSMRLKTRISSPALVHDNIVYPSRVICLTSSCGKEWIDYVDYFGGQHRIVGGRDWLPECLFSSQRERVQNKVSFSQWQEVCNL